MARADRRLVRPFLIALAVVMAVLVTACGDGVRQADVNVTVPTIAPPDTAGAEPGDTAITTTTEADTTDTTPAGTTDTTADGDVPPGQQPGDLGDDEALDALADDCFGGDLPACDRLFFESDVASDYEAYGDSCGGRNEPGGLCASIYGPG